MAIKKFSYQLKGEERPYIPRIDVRYLGWRDWETEDDSGRMYRYFISPGFFVQVASGSLSPIEAIIYEKNEEDFRKKLEELLGKEVIMKMSSDNCIID